MFNFFLHQAGVDQASGEGEEDQVQEARRRKGGDQVRPQREGDILIGNSNSRDWLTNDRYQVPGTAYI